MVFYLISNLFCFKFIARQQFVLKYLSVLLSYYIYKHLHLQKRNFVKFSSPRNINLICPKIKDKHINKEINSSFVVVEYIPFLSNLSK